MASFKRVYDEHSALFQCIFVMAKGHTTGDYNLLFSQSICIYIFDNPPRSRCHNHVGMFQFSKHSIFVGAHGCLLGVATCCVNLCYISTTFLETFFEVIQYICLEMLKEIVGDVTFK